MFSGNGMYGQGYYGPSLAGPAGQIASGLAGNSNAPFQQGMQAYQPWMQKGINTQNPFYQSGMNAIPQYQNWLSSMQNPSAFINNEMSQYQASPWSQYEQQQAQRAGTNAASASGLIGSTPFAQQMAQTSAGISSQDMQNWLGRVLGINSQYGQGLGHEVGWGQNSANQISNMYGQLGQAAGNAAYGEQAGKNQDRGNLLGGILGLAGYLI